MSARKRWIPSGRLSESSCDQSVKTPPSLVRESMLEDARAQQADNVDKLERAVAKNHERVKRAEEALTEATTDTAPVTQSTE